MAFFIEAVGWIGLVAGGLLSLLMFFLIWIGTTDDAPGYVAASIGPSAWFIGGAIILSIKYLS
jgi:hypothetical protein